MWYCGIPYSWAWHLLVAWCTDCYCLNYLFWCDCTSPEQLKSLWRVSVELVAVTLQSWTRGRSIDPLVSGTGRECSLESEGRKAILE